MPARPTWKGSLKLSLISIPIRVFLATSPGADVAFRQFHRKCHTPIQMKRWCPHCKQEVALEDIVKGHQTAKGRFVMVEKEDIARIRPESTRTVELTHLADASLIDPIYIERAYYVAPDNKAAGSSFAVLHEALADKAAIGRLAVHGREYLAAILPRDRELMLYTLRTAGEVRAAGAIDELRFAGVKAKPGEVKLARQVLDALEPAPDLSVFTDRYEEALRAMLKAKRPEVVAAAGGEAEPTKPADLMQALRESLAHAAGRKGGRVLPYAHRAHRPKRRAS